MHDVGTPPPRVPSPLRRGVSLMLLPAMAAVLTLVVIRHSLLDSRLSAPPVYDDVAYMLDGASRLTRLYEGGVPLLARDIWSSPPHSPLWTGLAACGFALFGMHDWAPYVMNVFTAGLVLGLGAYVYRGATIARRAMVMLTIATVPVAILSVHEFRPDIAAAALIALGAAIAVDPPAFAGPRARAALLGCIFGLSLLVKTSTCPVALALFGIAVLTSGLMHAPPGESRLRAVLREGLVASGALVLVAGPYYAMAWRDVYDYIYSNIFGHRSSLWAVGGGRSYHARFYIDGEGGDFMLGGFAYPLLTVAALGGVLAPRAGRGGENSRVGAAGLTCMIGLAYAVSAVNVMKQGFLGLPFQMLLVVGALLSSRLLLARLPVGRIPWATLALAGVLAVSLATFRFSNSWNSRANRMYAESWRLYDEVYAAVRNEIGREPALVLVTFTGTVNATNLHYRSVKDGAPIQFRSSEEAGTVVGYDFWRRRAGMVVAAQSGTGLTNDRFPSGKIHDQMVASLDADPLFRRVGQLPGLRPGRSFFIYRRVNPAPGSPSG